MSTIESYIGVEIENLEVDKFAFSFEYTIIQDGKVHNGYYESDHSWEDDVDVWTQILEKGEAVKLALEDYILDEA